MGGIFLEKSYLPRDHVGEGKNGEQGEVFAVFGQLWIRFLNGEIHKVDSVQKWWAQNAKITTT